MAHPKCLDYKEKESVKRRYLEKKALKKKRTPKENPVTKAIRKPPSKTNKEKKNQNKAHKP